MNICSFCDEEREYTFPIFEEDTVKKYFVCQACWPVLKKETLFPLLESGAKVVGGKLTKVIRAFDVGFEDTGHKAVDYTKEACGIVRDAFRGKHIPGIDANIPEERRRRTRTLVLCVPCYTGEAKGHTCKKVDH